MATLFQRSRSICQCQRGFSSFAPRRVNLQWEKNDPEALADALPAYPYGPTRWYKQSRLGLYGGARIRFGNNVSEEFETKSRRAWRPNILTRKLFSKALNRHVQVRVSARVLRTIDKLGGLDEYLLGEKEARIKELGETGWWLRWAIMQTPAVKARFAEERRRLGIPADKEDIAVSEEAVATANDAQAEGVGPAAAANAAESERAAQAARIKFRVGPKTHIYRSAAGWRRVWAEPWLTEEAVQRLARRFYPGWMHRQMEAAKAALQAQIDGLEEGQQLSADEQAKILESVKAGLDQQLLKMVKERNEKRMSNRRRRRSHKARQVRFRDREAVAAISETIA